MTVRVRVIPCLDVADGRVVKGVNFVHLKDAGDPVEGLSRGRESVHLLANRAQAEPGVRVFGPQVDQPAQGALCFIKVVLDQRQFSQRAEAKRVEVSASPNTHAG